ncbi:MAG: TRL domain-containing protein [Candidatus Nitrosoglobus sp.]
MKSKKLAAAIIGASATLAGCATVYPVGAFYTNVKLPMQVTDNTNEFKKGEATCQSILSLVATGDCSIEAAKENGGIRKVSHVDWDVENILGIMGTYKVTVYGE